MGEKILSIKEVENVKHPRYTFAGFDGYEIKTTDRTILLLIDNGQSCCESWGYFMSEDILSGFIGAALLDIKVVDDFLKTEQVVDTYEGSTMFVNLETNIGVLQFVAYNSHNGYYGHSAYVIVDDAVVHEDCL